MKARLLSTIVLLPIAIYLILKGGYYLLIPLMIISLIGLFEIYKIVDINKRVLGIIGYIACIIYYIMLSSEFSVYFQYVPVVFLIVMLVVYVLTYPKYTIDDILVGFFGFFYVALMLSYIYLVSELSHGSWLVWLIFISGWGSDSFAYLGGYFFGKHKLVPVLSPKKTIEGAIGGVLGAAMLGAIYALIIGNNIDVTRNATIIFAIICAGGSILAQFGDLAASAIKRNKNIKDFGNLIPGHGGVLDRFDSIIFTAPAVYFLTIFLK